MPDNAPQETPPDKTMRRWYEAKLAERLLQAGQMAQDRLLIRRGARKQQDGTLGQETTASSPAEEDPVNIRVGDEIHYHHEPQTTNVASSRPSAATSTLAKAAIATALMASGAGAGAAVPWLLGMFSQPPPAAAPAAVDTDTLFDLEIVPSSP